MTRPLCLLAAVLGLATPAAVANDDPPPGVLTRRVPEDPPVELPNEDISDFDVPAAPDLDRLPASAVRGTVLELPGGGRWVPRAVYKFRR